MACRQMSAAQILRIGLLMASVHDSEMHAYLFWTCMYYVVSNH